MKTITNVVEAFEAAHTQVCVGETLVEITTDQAAPIIALYEWLASESRREAITGWQTFDTDLNAPSKTCRFDRAVYDQIPGDLRVKLEQMQCAGKEQGEDIVLTA